MKIFKKILFIELGTILFAIAVGMFLLPGNVLTGGVAGIASLLDPYIDIPEEYLVIIITILLFILGCIFLDKEFITNTLLHTASYPVLLLIVTNYLPAFEVDPLLAAIYGGVIGGVGLGIIFRQGGSSGGMDVPPLIVEKYFHIKASKTIMFMDGITVLAGLFIYGLNNVLIGLISVYLTSFTMEKTMEFYGGIQARRFEIISDKYEAIADEIHNRLNRGSTLIDAQGGYTGEKRKILMVVVSEEQSLDVQEIINKYDSQAFVIMTETKDVNGEGFTFEPRI